jgi:hypothetical protein
MLNAPLAQWQVSSFIFDEGRKDIENLETELCN